MRIAVSACLLGQRCKYNGESNESEAVKRALAGHEAVPVCPEVLGGLPVPRPPAEMVRGEDGAVRIVNTAGEDVTDAFERGAREALAIVRAAGAQRAILQPRSPSCGVHEVYDGTFGGRLVPGQGVFAALLAQAGIPASEAGQ